MYTEDERESAREYQNLFIDDFKNVLTKGSLHEFADYCRAFLDITRFVWQERNNDNTPYSLEQYQVNVKKLVNACVETYITVSKILCLKLITAIYEELANCVKNEGIKLGKTGKQRRHFFLVTANDLLDLVRKIDINVMQDSIQIAELLYNMNLVDMALFYDSDVKPEDYPWCASSVIKDVQAALGSYIIQQKEKGNNPSVNYWTREFSKWFLADREKSISPELQPVFQNVVANCGALYTCGLISSGCLDIVMEGFYKANLGNLSLIGKTGKRALLAMYAFIYYMLVRESEEYVGYNLLKSLREFWPKVAQMFDNFIQNTIGIQELLITNLNSQWRYEEKDGKEERKFITGSRWLYYLLRRFDFRMRNSHGGMQLILEDSIQDFCVYSIVNMHEYLFTKRLDWMADVNHDIINFVTYIKQSKSVEVKKHILDYIDFITKFDCNSETADDLNERNKARANFIYGEIFANIGNLYKSQKIKEAKEHELVYLSRTKNIEDKRNKWKVAILAEIGNVFGDAIVTTPLLDSDYTVVHLAKIEIPSHMLESELDGRYTTYVVAGLMDAYAKQLIKTGCLECKIVQDFGDDKRYLSFLKNEKTNLMMGSTYLLRNKDWNMTKIFGTATENWRWITNNACFYGMALRKEDVSFCLKQIDIIIRTPDIADEENVQRIKDGFAYAPVTDVVLNFKEEELKNYLAHDKKEVDITAKIAVIPTGKAPLGFYIVDRRQLVENGNL